jgi:hypothetical protein
MPYDTFNANYSMRPGTIGQFVLPTRTLPKGQTMETAIQTLSGERADCDYFANFGYLGVWAPLLAFLAFRRKDPLPRVLGLLALASLLTAFGRFLPFHQAVTAVLPGLSLIQVAFRFIYLYTLALSALAGLGFHQLEKRLEEGRRGPAVDVIPWVWGGLLFLSALTGIENTGRELLALLGGATAFLLLRLPTLRRTGLLLLLAATVLPGLFMGWNSFSAHSRRNMDFARRVPPGFLETVRDAAPFRVFIGSDVPYAIEERGNLYRMGLPANLSTALQYRTFVGYDPLRLKGMAELMDLPFQTLLYLTGTRSIIQGSDMGDPKGFVKKASGDVWVYDLDPPPTLVSAPSEVRVVPDPAARLTSLKDPSFRPYMTALLDAPLPEGFSRNLPAQNVAVEYRLQAAEPDRQSWAVRVPEPALLVFSEVDFPGWRAFLDGKPSGHFTANHVFRAVPVPAGEHVVDFSFEPAWWPWFLPAFLVWLSTSAFFLLSLRKRSDTAS